MSRGQRKVSIGMSAVFLLTISVLPFTEAMSQSATPLPYKTAMEHAQLAVNATTLDAIQMHLHHVLNCLEGRSGKDFDAAAGNPCNGHGALQALKKGTADWIRALNSIALARVGVKLHDEKPAHYVAEAVFAILSEGK